MNYGTALSQSTSFKRRATSTYNGEVCFSETDPITITVLDQVNTGFILADQAICRVAGAPLTVDINDLSNIVANGSEPDDGVGDGVAFQWQFSADNNNWDDVIAGDKSRPFNRRFCCERYKQQLFLLYNLKPTLKEDYTTLIDPDISTIVYYRLKNDKI